MKWNIHPDQYLTSQHTNQAVHQYNNLVETCNNYSQNIHLHQHHHHHLVQNQSGQSVYDQSNQSGYNTDAYNADMYNSANVASNNLYSQMIRNNSESSSSTTSSSPLSTAPVYNSAQYSDYNTAYTSNESWPRYMNLHFASTINSQNPNFGANNFNSNQFTNGYQMKLEPTN